MGNTGSIASETFRAMPHAARYNNLRNVEDMQNFVLQMRIDINRRIDYSRAAKRKDIVKIYQEARSIAASSELTKTFIEIQEVKELKRRPKKSGDVLRALLNIVFVGSKTASRYWKRLEPFWYSNCGGRDVYTALVNGSSADHEASAQVDTNADASQSGIFVPLTAEWMQFIRRNRNNHIYIALEARVDEEGVLYSPEIANISVAVEPVV